MPKVGNGKPIESIYTSLDTECTGLDLYHGAKPFFVTLCDEQQNQTFYEWDVDPLTRIPQIPPADLLDIAARLRMQYDGWTPIPSKQVIKRVLQNTKFDVQSLATIGLMGWDWENTDDTLLAGHLLASNQPHDLTTMALIMLGVNIQPYEDALEKVVVDARTIARQRYPDWRIAKKGLPEMPSAKEKVWKFDSWLPRAIAQEENYPDDHEWWRVLQEYGNADSSVTLPLFRAQAEELKRRDLWEIYLERVKVLPVACDMETRGVPINEARLTELETKFGEDAQASHRICINMADGQLDKLPVSGTSNALKKVIFEDFKLVSNKFTDKGNDSMDKTVLEHWMATLPERSRPYVFVNHLRRYRKRMTMITYGAGYRRFWLPLEKWIPAFPGAIDPTTGAGWYVLHPSLNPTGTDTLRWSSSNPNEQNISKQGIDTICDMCSGSGELDGADCPTCDGEGSVAMNMRYAFGPPPGYEWWSCDAKNIELRLPAYEADETEMIELFERPNDPPYFGSVHLLMFDTLHPDKFAKYGAKVKDIFDDTWYQWTKNGDFAVQYGSVEQSGTADRAYHVDGAFRKIKGRFGKIHGPGGLNERCIKFAEQYGYVETMPDKTVNPNRGYPLLCTRSKWGSILPTVPLNYRVQGTAMWCMQKAMVRCHNFLEQWNNSEKLFQQFMERVKTQAERDGRYRLVMQIHDELVFEFPAGTGPKPQETNLPLIRELMRLMELSGDDIGIATPVSCKYHPKTWAEGTSI